MSYTPDEQLLKAPLKNLRDALDKTLGAMQARIDDNEQWSNDHVVELQEWHQKLSKMRQEVSVFSQEVS